jgi:uncharacterized membrane protein YkoI
MALTRTATTAPARRRRRYGGVVALLLALATAGLAADDYQDATRLRRSGEILPLQQVLERFRASEGGRVLEVDLKQRRGRHVYEIEFLDRDGRVKKREFDAATGRPLGGRGER